MSNKKGGGNRATGSSAPGGSRQLTVRVKTAKRRRRMRKTQLVTVKALAKRIRRMLGK